MLNITAKTNRVHYHCFDLFEVNHAQASKEICTYANISSFFITFRPALGKVNNVQFAILAENNLKG